MEYSKKSKQIIHVEYDEIKSIAKEVDYKMDVAIAIWMKRGKDLVLRDCD